jgi:hypothetical protein
MTKTKTSKTRKPVGTRAPKHVVDKVNGVESKTSKPKAKKEKFVAPSKPTTEPTGINRDDYGYTLPNGKFRFWQGYDAKFKKNLMAASRALPQTDLSMEARTILVKAGWSTMEREEAMVALEQQKADRAVERTKAKATKSKAA